MQPRIDWLRVWVWLALSLAAMMLLCAGLFFGAWIGPRLLAVVITWATNNGTALAVIIGALAIGVVVVAATEDR